MRARSIAEKEMDINSASIMSLIIGVPHRFTFRTLLRYTFDPKPLNP